MRMFVVALSCLSALTSGALAQSFDCSDRLRADEQAICDSSILSRLDERLAEAFENAIAERSETQRERIRNEQRDWVELRRNCRGRRSCIRRLYRDRLAEFRNEARSDLQDEGRASRRDLDDEARDGRDRWAALGSVDVEEDFERLTIPIGVPRGRFDALQVRVRGGGVRVRELVVHYANGERHRMRIRRRFRAGEVSDLLVLRHRGAGRSIERIVVRARSRRLDGREGRIQVIGRRVYRGGDNGPIAREYDDREYRRGDLDEDTYDERQDRDYREPIDRDERYPGDDIEDDQRVEPMQERLLDFVKTEFHRTAEMSDRELRQTYASRVDYYGDRGKPVSVVIRDKHKYAERWPDRAFRIRHDTFKVTDMEAPGVYKVTYNYDFHVQGKGRESKGYGESTLLIDTSGERFVIVGENGKVLKRL